MCVSIICRPRNTFLDQAYAPLPNQRASLSPVNNLCEQIRLLCIHFKPGSFLSLKNQLSPLCVRESREVVCVFPNADRKKPQKNCSHTQEKSYMFMCLVTLGSVNKIYLKLMLHSTHSSGFIIFLCSLPLMGGVKGN